MRAAFSLVGLLVTVGILALMWSHYTAEVAPTAIHAQKQAQQIAGVDTALGGHAAQHLTFEPADVAGKLKYLRVASIDSGSAYQTFYGLQANDYIDQIGPLMVRDLDEGTATAMAQEAYQRQSELGVWRNGQHFMLPEQKAQAARFATPAPAPQPAAVPQPAAGPAPAAAQQPQPQPQPQQPYVNPLHRQLDAITGPR